MKKNRNFTVSNLFWPGIFVLALLIAALGSNFAVFRGTLGQGAMNLLPNPAAPIQMSAGTTQVAQAPSIQDDIRQVMDRVLPAVVSVTRPGGGDGAAQNLGGVTYLTPVGGAQDSTGAGVIVDDRGYILTTFQTVGRSTLVKVHLSSGAQQDYLADVLNVDASCDLALLKIRANRVFPALPLANSDQLNVGDIVFAVGNPFGLRGSVTMGIVSSSSRKVTIGDIRYPNLIQTDAAINEGNDGGPLLNINGEVIGINMACVMPDHRYSGIGFAVPINDAAGLLSGQPQ